jgi:hypothetical protein
VVHAIPGTQPIRRFGFFVQALRFIFGANMRGHDLVARILGALLCLTFFPRAVGQTVPLDPRQAANLKLKIIDAFGNPLTCAPPYDTLRGDAVGIDEITDKNHTGKAAEAVLDHLGLTRSKVRGLDEKFMVYCLYRRVEDMLLQPDGNRYRVSYTGMSSPDGVPHPTGLTIDSNGALGPMVGENLHFAISPGIGADVNRANSPQHDSSPPVPKLQKLDHTDLRFLLVDRFHPIACGLVHPWDGPRTLARLEQVDAEALDRIKQRLAINRRSELSPQDASAILAGYFQAARIKLQPLVSKYEFIVDGIPDRGRTVRVRGIIADDGDITELQRLPSGFGCPL